MDGVITWNKVHAGIVDMLKGNTQKITNGKCTARIVNQTFAFNGSIRCIHALNGFC